MTSGTPRDTRLRLVTSAPIAAARRAVADPHRRPAPPPPEGTPPREQLARQARTALSEAVRVARWVERTGRSPVTEPARAAADLGLDEDELRRHWDRARLAGLVELHRDGVHVGWRLRAWDRDDAAVLRGWVALFDAWSLAHPAPEVADPGPVAEVVEAAPQLLSLLHLSAGPVTEPALLDLLAQRVAELHAHRETAATAAAEPPAGHGPTADAGATTGGDAAGDDRPPAHQLAALLDWALDGLAAVGALTRIRGGAEAGHPDQALLTPLGNWAVWTKLEQICVAAQSPAGNIEQSAAHMLRGCVRLSPGPARAEYRAWLAARPTGPAVEELLQVARGDDALLRGLAFEALRVVGAPAEPAVRAAAEEPTLRPYALLWLAEYEGADPEDLATTTNILTREEATWLWVDTAAAVTDHGESQLLVEHLQSAVQNSVPSLLEEVRATGHPRTVQVLVALAAAHPDPALAKAVRRAAFQVHTGDA